MDKCRSFDELPLLLRVEDLMPILSVGRNTAYELVRTEQIFSIRIGRQLRIPKQSVMDFINSFGCENGKQYENC